MLGHSDLMYRYWGKAKPKDKPKPGHSAFGYHCLVYHCLDVAAVGHRLLAADKPLAQRLAQPLAVSPEWLQTWFSFCLLMHDLGKFSRAFQGQVPELSSYLVQPNPKISYSQRHDSLGFLFWLEVLRERLWEQGLGNISSEHSDLPDALEVCDDFFRIVTGHHGNPPIESLERLDRFFQADDCQAAQAFFDHCFDWWLADFDFTPLLDEKFAQALKSLSWQLAGLAVLADWLGSNQSYFAYQGWPADIKTATDQTPPESIQAYWRTRALPAAELAIKQAGLQHSLLSTSHIADFQGIEALFEFIQTSTPLQQYAVDQPLEPHPQLFILEDVTGAGKTEAAMVLVQRLMTQGLGQGLYVGLPTMATADAMYERLGKVYRRLFKPDYRPSLVLAHGARELSKAFSQSVMLGAQPEDAAYGAEARADTETSASLYCNAWIADQRKKALLAEVGVGTLDQALLSVLPAKHQSLRMLGLMNKVLLVDEVHAYDPYMQRLLQALLQLHASQGGSAILLSATLPKKMRFELLKSYQRGLASGAKSIDEPIKIEQLDNHSYPLTTQFGGRLSQTPVATRSSVERQVQVCRLAAESQAYQLIEETLNAQKSICWIRNTVKEACATYRALQQMGWVEPNKLTLFHSRFAMLDRNQIRDRVGSLFGKHSLAQERAGQVLISTQVVEQSLDLDFDLLITDLAPIDLLIQRAGRLARHVRDATGNPLKGSNAQDQRGVPKLYLLSPDPQGTIKADWLARLSPGTEAVYENLGQLWLTAHTLLGRGQFSMPADARDLIETVYGDQQSIPEALEAKTQRAEGNMGSQISMARLNQLALERGYCRASAFSSDGWSPDTQIPTRLTNETQDLALIQWRDGQWVPYAQQVSNSQAQQQAWPLSQLSVPMTVWHQAKTKIPKALVSDLEQLKNATPALRWLELFPLCEETADCYNAEQGFFIAESKALGAL